LVTIEENPDALRIKTGLLETVNQTLDVSRLVRIFNIRKLRRGKEPKTRSNVPARLVRIGIAKDRAFCFYYPENLVMLEEAGAELVPFSPLEDRELPRDLDGLYIGGGYPESFPELLTGNEAMRREIFEFSQTGIPIYAECGGLMYLGRSLRAFDEKTYPMAGVLPVDTKMDQAHLVIKYVEVRTTKPTILGPRNTRARGQEFHQSRIISAEAGGRIYEVVTSANERFFEGFAHRNVLGSYIHLHFRSNPRIPANPVNWCLTQKKRRGGATPAREQQQRTDE